MKKKLYCCAITKNGKNCKNCVINYGDGGGVHEKCRVHSLFKIENQNENEEKKYKNFPFFLPRTTKKNIKKQSSLFLKNTEEIYGITSFDIVHSKEYNQTILLLGENHDKFEITECDLKNQPTTTHRAYIVDYINAILLSNPDMFFDIYLEIHLTIGSENKKLQPQEEGSMSPTITKIRNNLLSGCLEEIPGKKCLFPNIRVHAADARSVYSSTSYLYKNFIYTLKTDLQKRLKKFSDYINSPHFEFVKTDNLELLFHPIVEKEEEKNGGSSSCPQYDIHKIYEFFHVDEKSYVMKEINLIDDTKFNHKINIKQHLLKKLNKVRNRLISFYIDQAEPLLNKIEQVYKTQKPKFIKKNYNYFVSLKKQLIKLNYNLVKSKDIIMDLYTLARIFHQFKPPLKKEEEENFPKYATNIIYYGGGFHTDFTRKILKEFGFKEIYNAGSIDQENACIKAPSFEILEKKLIPANDDDDDVIDLTVL